MNTTAIYLRELAADINSGKIGIPLFQRKFIWDKEQIIDLFDSICKGYPIGSFLLWEREKEWKGTLDLLTDKENRDAEPISYILDGRQRLTSFYGCTLNNPDKSSAFCLNYDLETQGFGYFKSTSPSIIPVSEIYDTFTLLDKMDNIRQHFPEDLARTYIKRAKELNSILQEFVVSKITIGKCSLDEATNVFSRLNSKGTDISKTFMMQAMSYRKEGDKLLVPVLEGIARALAPYNFDNIGLDDLLNACFKFENKNFYDLSLKEMETLMPLTHEHQVKEAVINTTKFLFNECQVMSWSLLPYAKQFQALVWFFKVHPAPNESQINELRKWFYYTTISLSFQNSSIGNTRKIFNRLTLYIDGKSYSAIDYENLSMKSSLDFKISGKSAISKLFLLSLINTYSKHCDDSSNLKYLGHCHFDSTRPENYFILLSDKDKATLNRILKTDEPYDVTELPTHSLTQNMVELYRKGDLTEFGKERSLLLLENQHVYFKALMPELF